MNSMAVDANANANAIDFRAVKSKIRNVCKQRRVRLEEFMRTFDLHHTKKIRIEQFKRALDLSGLQLSTEELNVIVTKYRHAHDPNCVDYRRFCDLIDKVFTVKGMESNPQRQLHGSPGKLSTCSPSKPGPTTVLAERQQQELMTIKQKLQTAMCTKGIVFKDVFHDFDRSNSGKVTKTQFLRNLLDIVTLTSNEIDLLLKVYGDGPLDVNYRVLHHDLTVADGNESTSTNTTDASLSSPTRPQRVTLATTHRSGNHVANGATTALDQLEKELMETTCRDRIRLKNFFVDFDPLRSGKCSEAQFQRSVKLCFPWLTELELTLLVDKYRSEEKVEYMRFCHATQGKVEDLSLESLNPSATCSTNSSSKCSRELRGVLDSSKQQDLYLAVMQRLSNFVATRRVLMKPLFQDFDKARQESVSKEQFQRVLVMLKMNLLFVNEKEELQVLFRRYQSSHGDKFVNYVSFCHDIERGSNVTSDAGMDSSPVDPNTSERHLSKSAAVASPHAFVRNVPMLLRYIKQVVKRDRIRLEEFFRDFDKLRHYKVTQAQFASGLNEASHGVLVITPQEMELLSMRFAATDAKDAQGTCYVHWKHFVDEIETVFTVKELEAAPSRDLSDLHEKTLLLSPSNHSRLTQEVQETKVLELMQSIMQTMQQQRLDIKPAFEDFDRSKQGFITSSKFERVLSMFHLLPKDAQLTRMLALKFREESTTGTSTTGSSGERNFGSVCDVNYRAFLHALELLKTSGGGDPSSPLKTSGSIQLPNTNEYRQQVFATTSTMEGLKRVTRDIEIGISTDRHALQALLMDLRQQIDTKRIRLKEFLVEGDKLRSGEITLAKFHTALNRSGCLVDGKDIQLLNVSFQSTKHSDRIDWRRFLDAIDKASASTMTSSMPICSHPTTGGERDEDQTKQHIQKLLQLIKSKVSHRRLNMKTYFQDYDQNKVCRVTKFQFASVLNMMQLALPQDDIDLLSDHFAVSVGRKKLSDVNYVQFILQVDEEYIHPTTTND